MFNWDLRAESEYARDKGDLEEMLKLRRARCERFEGNAAEPQQLDDDQQSCFLL